MLQQLLSELDRAEGLREFGQRIVVVFQKHQRELRVKHRLGVVQSARQLRQDERMHRARIHPLDHPGNIFGQVRLARTGVPDQEQHRRGPGHSIHHGLGPATQHM
mgnify:CR=1 FL=1